MSSIAGSRLRLDRAPAPAERLADFLLLNTPHSQAEESVDVLRRQALRTAAVYQLHNTWRHKRMDAVTARDTLDHITKDLISHRQVSSCTN